MPKDMKDCENPDCTAKFIPYSSRQRVCKKESCKIWLMNQNFQKARYKFTKEFIEKELKEAFFDNSDNKIIDLENITFIRDDIEKVEE
jgi:hypothetical protein